jgi:hypothetical protein
MIKDESFEKVYNSIKRCYNETVQEKLPKINNDKDGLSSSAEGNFYKSMTLRIEAITELRKVRSEGSRLNIKNVWEKISESIRLLPVEATISSIGSQGFLSIPLFKYDNERQNFEFIRLHIWDNSLDKYINNREACEKFSIHTHAFHAESWILCGQVINDRFLIEEKAKPSPYSLFSIEYNSTLNKVNQHTSVAKCLKQFVEPIQVSHEVYMQNGYYSIKAGEFHRSGSVEANGISATLFSFTADKKYNGPSFVIGPNNINSSEINRKELIDPLELISKIDEKLN